MFTDVLPNAYNVLYRSVSPWEMASILETHEIRGRCGTFSGDARCSADCHTWFATTVAPIVHSGEDYLRYMQSLPMFEPIHAALDQLNVINNDAYDKLEAQRREHVWPVDRRLHRIYAATDDLQRKLGDAYRKAIFGLTKQARASAAKLPVTSYVLTITDMRGGVMYTDRDSLQRDAIEVCFPVAAAHALYEHIESISLVKNAEVIGHVFADELWLHGPGARNLKLLHLKLPAMRKATAQAALNAYERLRPKLREWIDV